MKVNDIRMSAMGGTICSIWASFSFSDIVQTALTAALGTLVSFLMSRLLGHFVRQKRNGP